MDDALKHATAMRKLAHAYHDKFGMNVVPLGDDKRPVVTSVSNGGHPLRFRWEEWQHKRQTESLFKGILRPAWWTQVQGIAAVCGPVSGNLVCIDFDGSPWEAVERTLALLNLPENYGWTVRTPGDGWHIWATCAGGLDEELTTGVLRTAGTYGGHVELRWTGHYAALPPSLHPSGGVYEFVFGDISELTEAG